MISYVVDLLFGHGKKYLTDATGFVDEVVGGWGVDGITMFQNCLLLAFNNAIPNYTATFGGGFRPNAVADCKKSSGVGDFAKLGEWYSASCFTAPADFTYGNEFRTDPTLRSSGVNNWNFALFKKTIFSPDERLGIAFRAEFLNIFNRNQWAPPNTSVSSSAFGQVSCIYPAQTGPHPVRTEIYVLDLQTHGMAVQSVSTRRFLPAVP